MGGKVRLIIAGGAPLSPETHELVKTTLCTLLLQGYGLTESTSSTAVQDGEYYFRKVLSSPNLLLKTSITILNNITEN